MKHWKHDSLLKVSERMEGGIEVGREAPKAKVMEHIGRTAVKVLEASYCMIAYLEQSETHFISLGMDEQEVSQIDHLPVGIGLLGQLWEDGQKTIRLDQISAHRKSSGCPHGHPQMGAFLGTPIRYDDQILGVIYLSKPPGICGFSTEDEKTLEVLASACAIELSNARIFEEMKQAYAELEVRTDELNQANRQLRQHENELEKQTAALDAANKQLKIHTMDLELLNEELTVANRAKDQFLANTSHELRTPLNAIIGFSELLGDKRLGLLSSKQERYVGHISSSGNRLLGIINALLDISKIESGMMEIDETVFNPVELGHQLMAELMALAANKQIELIFNALIPADTNIQSDQDKLYQVLINLVGNAIKFTPDKGRIELEMRVSEPHTHSRETMLCCRVIDNGIGISVEDQGKIFKPFVQASTGMTRTHSGTGLGLSLSKHMIELLGGTIRLDSQSGEGSTFEVELPVTAMNAGEKIVATEAEESSTSVSVTASDKIVEEILPGDLPQAKVMIVDEDHSRATAASMIFQDDGYQVLVTDLTGAETLAAENDPFLMVLGMPDDAKTTYERLQLLKCSDATNKIPTILLAGDADQLSFTTGGAIGHLDKEMGSQDLLDMVSHLGTHIFRPPSAPTVLVVDDEASVREYLKETLVAEGYRILLASNGADGIQLAIDRDPDLIILDLMMPGMSGFDVIKALRNDASACDIPVVIFTAKELSRSEALLLGQDVERILVKGVSSRKDVLHQLHKLELLYPVRAKLMDTKLECFNFRYMQRRLEHEVSRANRYHHHFSLLAWKMDGFDKYCDKHGKRWGLAALKASVALLHAVIRKADVLARMDHDCLILLLPGLSLEESYYVAEKIRLRIGRHFLPLPNNQKGKMTVSIGGVASTGYKDSEKMIALLHHRVKTAMDEGGNRIIVEG